MTNHHERVTYALRNWSAKRLAKGWYIAPTSSNWSGERTAWKGPYTSMASAMLMIARELGKELAKRHGRSS